MANQKELWILQLIKYFVVHKGYTQVRFINVANLNETEKDVWLANPSSFYPAIHITTSSQASNYANMERINEELTSLLNVLKKNGKLIDICLDSEGTHNETDKMIHLALYPGCQLPQNISSAFENLNTVIFNVDDPEQEAKRLEKDITDYTLKNSNFKEKRRQAIKESLSVTFIVFSIICFVVFLLVNLGTYLFKCNPTSVAIALGAYYKGFVVIFNDWWRLLTGGFVHISIWHIWCNLLALYSLSKTIESKYGVVKTIIIVLVSIIVGNLCVFIGDANIVAVGLSGGIYGLLASMIIIYWQLGYFKIPVLRKQIWNIILVNLLINFIPNVSFLAHLGGFVAGLFLSFILSDDGSKTLKTNFVIVGISLSLILGYFASQSMKLDSFYTGTDKEVSEIFKQIGLENIADNIKIKTTEYYKGA